MSPEAAVYRRILAPDPARSGVTRVLPLGLALAAIGRRMWQGLRPQPTLAVKRLASLFRSRRRIVSRRGTTSDRLV
jgi:hypothetical protein